MRKILFSLSLCIGFSMALNAQSVALRPGNTISNILLKNTNGGTYDFKAQKTAKGFIVVFMTPSCDHCRAYEKRVIALDQKYKGKGYPVVAIGPYGDYPNEYPLDALAEMNKLAKNEGFTFPYLSDSKFKYTTLLGVQKTPTAFVLQKKANGFLIVYKGDIDDELDAKKQPKHKFVEEQVNKLIK
ncbi:redoxin domain-containing protein [Pedobacter insulae]|uniref:Peroxiredoxin n=1 Tax=Pedobacter insulae TaxID=414048 RepID=A0A1I2WR64_9SPHI|nr:redoxin domain-containing protein [Pedobacter insulae]SFH02856.1 Peroxiredoxin [Pedobacter insulae]